MLAVPDCPLGAAFREVMALVLSLPHSILRVLVANSEWTHHSSVTRHAPLSLPESIRGLRETVWDIRATIQLFGEARHR
jgi:hypothetical protein